MGGEKKAPVKLLIGLWGFLALSIGLSFALVSWVNRDHKTMGGLAVYVRSSDVQVADGQAETDPEFDHELADLHGARKGVAVLLERDPSLESAVRDLLTREGYSVVDDAREARFVAEIGLAPWKPGSSVSRLHSLRLWDAGDNCLVSFMAYSQSGPFLNKPQEVAAGALLEFYRYDGLALRRGRDDAFFSRLTASTDGSRPGEVFYESRPDMGRPRQRVFVAFIERGAEYAGAAAPDAEAMFYRSLHKAGWDVAVYRRLLRVLGVAGHRRILADSAVCAIGNIRRRKFTFRREHGITVRTPGVA